MRILLLNWRDLHHPKAGGAEIVTMEHAKGWVLRGHSVTWITSHYGQAKSDEIIEGVHIKRRAGSLLIYVWGFFYTLFQRSKYDVVVDEIHAIPFFTPLIPRIKCVAFLHEVAGDIWNYMAPFPLNRIGKLLEQLYIPLYKNTYVWTDAESTIDELASMGIPKKRCIAIPCPINTSIPEKWRAKESVPVFLFVSRVVAMKGIEEVIKAFRFIKQELPTAQLWIVGGGDASYIRVLNDLIHEVELSGHVTFHGKVSESQKLVLMEKSHVLLHASVKEGWGLVVLESLSRGTPAVVYNVAGLKDVVHDDKTGVVLKNNSPRELAREALSLYKDKKRYERYQKEGKKWVSSLSWETVIDQSEALLIKVMNEK